jgi:hypothetical protein
MKLIELNISWLISIFVLLHMMDNLKTVLNFPKLRCKICLQYVPTLYSEKVNYTSNEGFMCNTVFSHKNGCILCVCTIYTPATVFSTVTKCCLHNSEYAFCLYVFVNG